MDVHLVDGTYELFRHFFAVPPHRDPAGLEVGAVRGVLRSMVGLLESGATHVGVATDHVIESFRNAMWGGYKTGLGIDPLLKDQFPVLEDVLRALGLTVWAMVEQEADDALAAAAAVGSSDERIERVFICTPDKDLAQCVVGTRVVQLDRRARVTRDEAGIVAKFGVAPASIPDYLALVGDAADGFPGIPGWGAKSAAAVLAAHHSIEQIPPRGEDWNVKLRNRLTLSATLEANRDLALLFKDLATLRTDADVGTVDSWRWSGPTEELKGWCERLDANDVLERATALASARAWG